MRCKPSGRIELWGGIECTVNRVRDRYFNQLTLSGHHERIDDLDAIAALGIKTVRYPVLWELMAPNETVAIDWRWADERLSRLRSLGIEPVVGFVHHGSGPRYTSLLHDTFATGLADYARQFAERFPWVLSYTPVNEPLTTARFSALYGHWYPHARDDRSFVRALLNQCSAVASAMRAIRFVNSDARLVQTDDLGRVCSTPALSYQADFENERRWLCWDWLSGRVNQDHPLAEYLQRNGITAQEREPFLQAPCVPDVIGINHYVTSNRFLDDQHHLYPARYRGGNGRDTYADVEAVRVAATGEWRVRDLLREAWQRYSRPVAVTEAHLGCTREEQMRWLHDVWSESRAAQAEGVDVRAVTAWALFGSFNWNTLVTANVGYYEPGAFDVRSPRPRATAIAPLLKRLANDEDVDDELSRSPGWWRRNKRFVDAALPRPEEKTPSASPHLRPTPPILICGGAGTLGQAFGRICERRGLAYRISRRADLDISNETSITNALEQLRPWAVINAAGYVRVDDAERDFKRCFRENTLGPQLLANACAQRSLPLLTFSSDLVFDGLRTEPYAEQHSVAPMNVYGSSKARAERVVLRAHATALVIRTSAFFGPWDSCNFVAGALETLAAGKEFTAIDDLIVSPTYVPDLVDASLDLLIDRATGIWHLANQGSLSWAELASRCATLAAVSTHRLRNASWRSLELAAYRPAYSVLTSERGLLLPALDEALDRYVAAWTNASQ